MDYIGNILYDEQLYKEPQIVIFGAGKIGKKIIGFLDNNNCKKNIKCICDNNNELWNKQLEGIMVVSPLEAVRKYKRASFLVGGSYADEMIKYLIASDISRIHILLIN